MMKTSTHSMKVLSDFYVIYKVFHEIKASVAKKFHAYKHILLQLCIIDDIPLKFSQHHHNNDGMSIVYPQHKIKLEQPM